MKPASCPGPLASAPNAASLAIPPLASLDPAPLVVPPLEASPPLLSDTAPLPLPLADPPGNPEFQPALPPPLAIPGPEGAVEVPPPDPAVLAPVAAPCSMPGPVWVALHAAASKTVHPIASQADLRFTSHQWSLGRASINNCVRAPSRARASSRSFKRRLDLHQAALGGNARGAYARPTSSSRYAMMASIPSILSRRTTRPFLVWNTRGFRMSHTGRSTY